MVRDAAEQLRALLNNILDLAKMESSQLLLCLAPFSLAGLLDSVAAVVTTAAQEKGLTVSLEKDPGLPEVVLGDELRLRQIFVNLRGNALKFTQKGGITIQVAMESAPGTTARVLHCRVIDTGIGISAAKLEAIFESFQQGDDSYNRQYGGQRPWPSHQPQAHGTDGWRHVGGEHGGQRRHLSLHRAAGRGR